MQKFYINQERRITKIVTEEDIDAFAKVSGDYNPIHIDDEYAAKSIFKKRIAHGMLSASYISAILGTDFPGIGTIYMGQTLRFLKPVYVGDTIELVVRLKELGEKGRATLQTNVLNMDGDMIIEGEALVKLPK